MNAAVHAEQLRYALGLCLKSARAVPAERANWRPRDGGGQSPLELLRHMVQVNGRLTAALHGQAPPETVPANDYGAALDALEDSGNALAGACEALPAAPPKRAQLMTIGLFHLVYHWGQLCYLQTLWDDDKDHFLDP